MADIDEEAALLAAGVFTGRDADRFMAYLYNTAMTPLPETAEPMQVMHREGQRFLVAKIQTLINAGRKMKEKESDAARIADAEKPAIVRTRRTRK